MGTITIEVPQHLRVLHVSWLGIGTGNFRIGCEGENIETIGELLDAPAEALERLFRWDDEADIAGSVITLTGKYPHPFDIDFEQRRMLTEELARVEAEIRAQPV